MGTEEPFSFNDPKLYYRSIYFQCLDAAMAFIKDRFHQRDYSIYSNLEQLLIKTCSKKDYSQELKEITDLFSCRLQQVGVGDSASTAECNEH